jgi:3'-phosphoadenosine 5'-phosphosulfate sulfotransferase (PAPS reductase)/FAD synthetase
MTTAVKHLVGFSGGIDSQACARWVLNRFPAEDVILLNSDAGGNEHPITTEFVRWYSANIHPVIEISPEVQDMAGRSPGKIAELGLQPTDPMDFGTMAQIKGRFPASRSQFCTHHLKLEPQKRWIETHMPDAEIIRYSGVRRDESRRRSNQPLESWDEFYDCTLLCPIADWTKTMCFDYAKAHDGKYNELYTLGFNRVGCAPCINSGKDDILAWATRFPEMIDKVRRWEQQVGRTFFPPMVPGMQINFVDDVVQWAHTVHGGKQMGLHVLVERPACESRYGLCE